jgi:EAL domain-containing protein (putative c-di-GMP-specific phosphodiesterase class I)
MAPVHSYKQNSGNAETFGGTLFCRLQVWKKTNSGTIGLIGLDLSGVGLACKPPFQGKNEPAWWDEWLNRTLGEGKAVFGDRFGFHLWLFAGIPEPCENSPQHYLEGLAIRILDHIQMDKENHEKRPGKPVQRDRGYGTALLPDGDDTGYKQRLYEAFLEAASRLQGWNHGKLHAREVMEMERILREGDIRSAYQPIFRLRSGFLHGFEALTRCPQGSVFDGPATLFQFADQAGYSFALDRLARESAIRCCPRLDKKQKVFININSGIMKDPHFVSGQTRGWLSARGLQPGQVVLELTERSSIDDFEEAKLLLNHYRSQGYAIAIDDVGAGYSSLQAIVELRPDYIKLDKSLVHQADRDEMKLQMLRTFVRFAKKMRILTIAEGIERPEELHLVRKMGIDFGQGYLIGRPSETPVYTLPTDIRIS